MKLVPLGERVVLKRADVEETTASGIILPGQSKEKPAQATVVAVGPGKVIDGKSNMVVKEGDVVVFSKYAGSEIKVGDEDFIIVGQNDILAILK